MSSNINNDRIELLEKLEKSTHQGRIKWRRLEADSLVFTHETKSNVIEFTKGLNNELDELFVCLLYTSPSPRDGLLSRMPSSA